VRHVVRITVKMASSAPNIRGHVTGVVNWNTTDTVVGILPVLVGLLVLVLVLDDGIQHGVLSCVHSGVSRQTDKQTDRQ